MRVGLGFGVLQAIALIGDPDVVFLDEYSGVVALLAFDLCTLLYQ